jgi:hypothetical protein
MGGVMEIDTIHEYILMRLYRADQGGKAADPVRTPHAASYAYVVFPLAKTHPKSTYSRAIELIIKNGLVETAKADCNGLFVCPKSGKKRLVKKSLLNKWVHEQEILYLTDTGVAWVRNRQAQIDGAKEKRRAREQKR